LRKTIWLYSYRTINSIADTDLHSKLGIPKVGNQYACGKHDLFAAVIALRYLLTDADFRAFKRGLQRVFSRYLKNTTALSESDINEATGFPANWRKITRFKK